ncbi:hypothetical protein B0A49_13349 [Cryomyces minteri]|uniref:GDP-Man:Man(3)GlcNAc(2)-PP-Dol alpha-1,2-mannosyltransferase n=1 Tax=Cryomyces minteri TaxID=331657 RepID=A0A4U0V9B8_9PEZI|nr:hypothetical protein B0A49_13349 [Cryomyces minteri]
MLCRVEDRFNIHLHPPTVVFLYLTTRNYVLASKYPHFTLLGQSLGSLVLAYDAFSLLVPDIFIDTMGYAFALALVKLLFPDVPTAAYVHYPTISTDMLGSLDDDAQAGRGVNAGLGRGWKGKLKRHYWHFFARLYSWVGGEVDVVMTNSSWTQNHIRQLWGASRRRRKRADNDIAVVFPPVAVEELEREIDVGEESEKSRHPHLLYIAQFRPEKNHQLVLTAFARFLHSQQHPSTSSSTPSTTTTTTTPGPADPPKLILIGSVRDSDDATRVYKLRLLAHELKIKESVTFVCDASWPQILSHLRTASVGVNAMWNEHFGIGVVEYQAAGLLAVVHDSGGPRGDIVVDVDGDGSVNDDIAGRADAGADNDGGGGRGGGGGGGGGTGPTGFRATDAASFALAFSQALALPPQDRLAMRRRARVSAKRFGEAVFARRWVGQMERLVELRRSWETGRRTGVNVGVGGGGGPDRDGGGGQITGRHD